MVKIKKSIGGHNVMLKKIISVLLLFVCMMVFISSPAVAATNGTTSSGWNIYVPTSGYPAYRYGSSMIINSDDSIDLWCSSPGETQGEWDWIRHKKSTDGGTTWGAESVVLKPTSGSNDKYSTCDPGIIKFGGYYYIGYTSTVEPYGTDNNIFVARSTSSTGPFSKWNGSGWGGNPVAIITHDGDKDRFGVGEPSFVKKDDTLYIFYNYVSRDANNRPIEQTRLATADATSANWPSTIQYQGVAFDRTESRNEDSADIKYVDTLDKFIAVSTARRFRPESYVRVRESSNGLNFTNSNMSKDYIQPYCHNIGITGTVEGHLDTSDSNRIAYAYGTTWGVWNTYMNPVSLSSNSKPAVPKVIAVHPENGEIKVYFETTSGVTYKIKYGNTSGSYSNTITSISSSPYTITGLTNGTPYYLTMVATSGGTDSDNSEQYCVVPLNYSDAPCNSVSVSSSLSGWDASKVIDGNVNTAWSSQYYSFDNRHASEWVKVDTGGNRGIKRITVTPTQPKETCYNGKFYIEVSQDGSNWVKPDVDFREYRIRSTYNKYVYDFAYPIYARYVRLTSTELYFDEYYGCYFQFAEIDIEEIPYGVSASSNLSGWEPAKVADNHSSTNWSSNYHSTENNTEWVYIDTGVTQNITGVRLKPRGYCFPKDFKLQYSTNGSSWTDIPGQSYTNYSDPGTTMQPFIFSSGVNARYIRLYATKLRADQYGYYYCQLADFLFNTETKRTATASTSISGWSASKVTDCIGDTCWSSNSHSSASSTEWIYVDIGSQKKVSGLRVYPRTYCFPEDFKIQYSNNASSWTDVAGQTYTGYYDPEGSTQRFVFTSLVDARYIRIYATKLRKDQYDNYYFQLGEIFVD